MKVIQSVKEKCCEMLWNAKSKAAATAGAAIGMIASTTVAYASNGAESSTGGIWGNIAAWINNNAEGLKIVCYALIGLCVVAAVILIALNGSQGLSKVKNWLIGLAVAVLILVFGQAFIDSISTIGA